MSDAKENNINDCQRTNVKKEQGLNFYRIWLRQIGECNTIRDKSQKSDCTGNRKKKKTHQTKTTKPKQNQNQVRTNIKCRFFLSEKKA